MKEYELINEYEDVIYCYSVEVYSEGEYVRWGISYNTEEEAINCIKEYLSDIKDFDSEYYRKEYTDYSSHPIRVTRKICARNWQVYEKSIDINNYKCIKN